MAALNGRTRESRKDERGGDLSVRGEESESPGIDPASLRGRPKSERDCPVGHPRKIQGTARNKLLSPVLNRGSGIVFFFFLRTSQERNHWKPVG